MPRSLACKPWNHKFTETADPITRCPMCGSSDLVEVQTVGGAPHDDPLAGVDPGKPTSEILTDLQARIDSEREGD